MSKPALLAAGAGALALGLAACGGSSSTSSSASATSTASSSAATSASTGAGAGGSVGPAVAAQPSGKLAFTKQTLSAKAGTVKIAFANKSPLPHNLTLQKGKDGAVVGATPTFDGGSKTLTVKLTPGTYTFFCSVPGHRTAGMQGTLTVK